MVPIAAPTDHPYRYGSPNLNMSHPFHRPDDVLWQWGTISPARCCPGHDKERNPLSLASRRPHPSWARLNEGVPPSTRTLPRASQGQNPYRHTQTRVDVPSSQGSTHPSPYSGSQASINIMTGRHVNRKSNRSGGKEAGKASQQLAQQPVPPIQTRRDPHHCQYHRNQQPVHTHST